MQDVLGHPDLLLTAGAVRRTRAAIGPPRAGGELQAAGEAVTGADPPVTAGLALSDGVPVDAVRPVNGRGVRSGRRRRNVRVARRRRRRRRSIRRRGNVRVEAGRRRRRRQHPAAGAERSGQSPPARGPAARRPGPAAGPGSGQSLPGPGPAARRPGRGQRGPRWGRGPPRPHKRSRCRAQSRASQ